MNNLVRKFKGLVKENKKGVLCAVFEPAANDGDSDVLMEYDAIVWSAADLSINDGLERSWADAQAIEYKAAQKFLEELDPDRFNLKNYLVAANG